MKRPVAVHDSSSRFSLKKLFVIPVVFAVALLLWRVSPLHGVVGLIAASTLSAAILLARRSDHAPLATKFVLALLFAILVGFVSEVTLSVRGPNDDIRILFFLVAIALGGVLGWSIAHLITQRGQGSDSRATKLVAAVSAVALLFIVFSVPLWTYLQRFSS